jgi:hypothetical protein
MPIFIISPYIQSGAPEALHQLCHYLNYYGTNSYIFYTDKPKGHNLLYKDLYPLVQEANVLEDHSIIIYFEIYTYKYFEEKYNLKNSIFMLWWLSINNALTLKTMDINIKNQELIHLFHGHYIKETIVPLLSSKHRWYFLHDYLSKEFTNLENKKEDIIAYNPTKDFISGPLLVQHQFKTLPLVELKRKELINLLKNCKIYIDLGSHSGRDRLPREAALLGCVIITSNFCATQNEHDIAIPSIFKMKNEKETLLFVQKVLDNYDYYYEMQKEYRESLLLDEFRMREQVKFIMDHYLCTNDKLRTYITSPNNYSLFYNFHNSHLGIFTDCNKILELGILNTKAMLSELVENTNKTYYVSIYHQKTYEQELMPYILKNTNITYTYYQADTLKFMIDKNVDLLIIDTWHVYGQLIRELKRYHHKVNKYILIYKTELYKHQSETSHTELEMQATGYTKDELEKGIYLAIQDFIQEYSNWIIYKENTEHEGYVILANNALV